MTDAVSLAHPRFREAETRDQVFGGGGRSGEAGRAVLHQETVDPFAVDAAARIHTTVEHPNCPPGGFQGQRGAQTR